MKFEDILRTCMRVYRKKLRDVIDHLDDHDDDSYYFLFFTHTSVDSIVQYHSTIAIQYYTQPGSRYFYLFMVL